MESERGISTNHHFSENTKERLLYYLMLVPRVLLHLFPTYALHTVRYSRLRTTEQNSGIHKIATYALFTFHRLFVLKISCNTVFKIPIIMQAYTYLCCILIMYNQNLHKRQIIIFKIHIVRFINLV